MPTKFYLENELATAAGVSVRKVTEFRQRGVITPIIEPGSRLAKYSEGDLAKVRAAIQPQRLCPTVNRAGGVVLETRHFTPQK